MKPRTRTGRIRSSASSAVRRGSTSRGLHHGEDAGPHHLRQSIPSRHHQSEVRRKCAGICAAALGDRGFSSGNRRFVRFLSPPLAGFHDRLNSRRTRCDPSGCSGFCSFVRNPANPRGHLLRWISRCNSVGFRVALFALRLRPNRPPCPAHHVFKMVVPRHQVVLGRHLRGVSEPLRHHVGRVLLDPVGRTGRSEILEDPGPGLVARLQDDPLQR